MQLLVLKAFLILALSLWVLLPAGHPGGNRASNDIKTISFLVGRGLDFVENTPGGKRIRGQNRVKKSAAPFLGEGVKGLIAATRLLKGTVQIGTKEKNVRLFHKTGDFESAMADFNSLKPWLVTRKSYPGGNRLVTGVVGDRLIVLDKKGRKQNPMVTVLREFNGVYDSADKIIYFKDSM